MEPSQSEVVALLVSRGNAPNPTRLEPKDDHDHQRQEDTHPMMESSNKSEASSRDRSYEENPIHHGDCREESSSIHRGDCGEESAAVYHGDCEGKFTTMRHGECGEESTAIYHRDCGEESTAIHHGDCGEESTAKRHRDCGEESTAIRHGDCGEESTAIRHGDCGEESTTKLHGDCGEESTAIRHGNSRQESTVIHHRDFEGESTARYHGDRNSFYAQESENGLKKETSAMDLNSYQDVYPERDENVDQRNDISGMAQDRNYIYHEKIDTEENTYTAEQGSYRTNYLYLDEKDLYHKERSSEKEICLGKGQIYERGNENMYRNEENLSLDHESRPSRNYAYNESDVSQAEDASIMDREFCQETNYLKQVHKTSTYHREEHCPDRKYGYPEDDDTFQKDNPHVDNMKSYEDKGYIYQPKDENNFQREEASTMEQEPTQQRSYVYLENDSHIYHREDSSVMDQDNYQDKSYNYQEDNTYHTEGNHVMNQDRRFYYQEANEYQGEEITEMDEEHCQEKGYGTQEDNIYHKEETSAVDLRISRSLDHFICPRSSQSPDNNKKEPTSVAQLLESFYLADSLTETSPSLRKINLEENTLKPTNIAPDLACYEEVCRGLDPSENPKEKDLPDHYVYEITHSEDQHFWNAGTNTDPLPVIDKESQTRVEETRDVAVQTDTEPTFFSFPMLKQFQEELAKHTCPICQRVYLSKHSFDRHFKTHEKDKKNKIFTNIRFTTEAKLRICKRAGKPQRCRSHKPIIIQLPRSVLDHGQKEEDELDLIDKPFPMIKCPECPVQFYTMGALNEHTGIVHKEESSYYCVFCNERFNAVYNFHLHLDKHLSP